MTSVSNAAGCVDLQQRVNAIIELTDDTFNMSTCVILPSYVILPNLISYTILSATCDSVGYIA